MICLTCTVDFELLWDGDLDEPGFCPFCGNKMKYVDQED